MDTVEYLYTVIIVNHYNFAYNCTINSTVPFIVTAVRLLLLLVLPFVLYCYKYIAVLHNT